MAGNSFGKIFKITTFGESHGKGVGVVIDGCPSGLTVNFDRIHRDLQRRKPGQSSITTSRNEDEEIEVLSGIINGCTTGAPIAILVRNKDHRPEDYDHIKDIYRPSHADFTYDAKYGLRDHRGGGRSSARTTLSMVIAGAIAKQILEEIDVQINGIVSQVGHISIPDGTQLSFDMTETNAVRCPHPETAEKMISLIEKHRDAGDTIGGIISCYVENCPVGLGIPVFDKLHADLAKAMFSINAVKGFEVGSGFDSVTMLGSEHNDSFEYEDGEVSTTTNHSGGIQGGISNGMDINFNVAFKPVSTLQQKQKSINSQGEKVDVEGKGRHDPCVVPRAVVIVEAMTALVILDHYLRDRSTRMEYIV